MTQVVVSLKDLAALGNRSEAGLPVGAVRITDDGNLDLRSDPAPSRHHFWLDGLLFHISITPEDGQTLLQIWAEAGYMPYTIEAPEKRETLQAVMRAAAGLPHVRFTVDEKQRILVLSQQTAQGHVTLTDLMYEIVQFVQQARPFIRVLGQYL